MNQERLHAAAGERWERVASSFLRPAPAPRFLVGVSGADDEQRVQRIAREVRVEVPRDVLEVAGRRQRAVLPAPAGDADAASFGSGSSFDAIR